MFEQTKYDLAAAAAHAGLTTYVLRREMKKPHLQKHNLGPPLCEKSFLQFRSDLKLLDRLPDCRLLVRRFNAPKEGGRRPFEVIDAPRVLLVWGHRLQGVLAAGRALHRQPSS